MNNALRYCIVVLNALIILFFWTFLVRDSIFQGAYEIVFKPSQSSQLSDSNISDEIKGEIESFTIDSIDSMDSMEKQQDNKNAKNWDGYGLGPIHVAILISMIVLVLIVTLQNFKTFKNSDWEIIFSDIALTNIVMHPTILSFADLQNNMRILIISIAILSWLYLIILGIIAQNSGKC